MIDIDPAPITVSYVLELQRFARHFKGKVEGKRHEQKLKWSKVGHKRLGGAGLAGQSGKCGEAAHATGRGLRQRHWHQEEASLAEIHGCLLRFSDTQIPN